MTNLLKETLDIIKENGYTEKDVKWVGSRKYYFTFEHFKTIADVEYDSGYGAQKVAGDLLVVGDGWWLERHEYDGSEWWEFKKGIEKPDTYMEFGKVIGGMWDSLESINGL